MNQIVAGHATWTQAACRSLGFDRCGAGFPSKVGADFLQLNHLRTESSRDFDRITKGVFQNAHATDAAENTGLGHEPLVRSSRPAGDVDGSESFNDEPAQNLVYLLRLDGALDEFAKPLLV